MQHRIARAALVLSLTIAAASGLEAQERAYKQGAVINVTEVRTMPGQYDNYLNYIFGDYAKLMEAQKKAGVILDWSVYSSQPRSRDEADLVLVTVYSDMAALDGLEDRTDPIVQQVMNLNRGQAAQASVTRESLRTLIGSNTLRQLIAK
jgi:hypothetical protein